MIIKLKKVLKLNNILKFIIIAIIIICTIKLSNYSIKNNIDELGKTIFWNVTIADIINIILTMVIAIIIVNMQSKSEKEKEAFKKVIEKFQSTIMISISDLVDLAPEITNKNLLTHMRKLNNQYSIIEKYSKLSNSKENVKYIKGKINEYSDLLSENMFDLAKIESQSEKLIENIDNKCEEIKLELY